MTMKTGAICFQLATELSNKSGIGGMRCQRRKEKGEAGTMIITAIR